MTFPDVGDSGEFTISVWAKINIKTYVQNVFGHGPSPQHINLHYHNTYSGMQMNIGTVTRSGFLTPIEGA